MGFVKSDTDPNLYYLMVQGESPILVLYVDDLFLTRFLGLIKDCKRNLAPEFDMKDLGLMHYFLGLEVWQKDGEIFLGQGRWLFSSLMYVVNTRLDICFAVNTLNQFMVDPKRMHWTATRHIQSRKKNSVALSSAEAEYMAASKATCEAIWLQKLLVSLFKQRIEATSVDCDNQSCIKLS
eukprot:PITA_08953